MFFREDYTNGKIEPITEEEAKERIGGYYRVDCEEVWRQMVEDMKRGMIIRTPFAGYGWRGNYA